MSDEPKAEAGTDIELPDLNLAERMRQFSKDRDSEPKLRGKCKVCQGLLVPDLKMREFSPIDIMGPGGSPAQYQDGLYCEDCGIRYHHPPSDPPDQDAPPHH